ncbi:hypothetical protein LINGRAHAP2_LOCUS36088 [Linum grandiflorum]
MSSHHRETVGAVIFYLPFSTANPNKPITVCASDSVPPESIAAKSSIDIDVTVEIVEPSSDSFMLYVSSNSVRSSSGRAFTGNLKARRQSSTEVSWLGFASKNNIGLQTAFLKLKAGDAEIISRVCIMVENNVSLSLKALITSYNKEEAVSIPDINTSLTDRSSGKRMKTTRDIPMYEIDQDVRVKILEKTIVVPSLWYTLYFLCFSRLLQIEEVGKEQDLAQYKMERVKLRKSGNLIVVDLAEPRPPIANNDFVSLTRSGSSYPSKKQRKQQHVTFTKKKGASNRNIESMYLHNYESKRKNPHHRFSFPPNSNSTTIAYRNHYRFKGTT